MAAGLAIVAGLSLLDVSWGRDHVVIATVMLGGFVTALFAGAGETAIVAVAAVAATAASGGWDHNFGRRDYLLRLAVVAVGAAFAIASARQRERVSTDQQRFRLLSAAASDADPSATVAEVVRRLSALLVPAAAEVCTVDYLLEGSVARSVVAAPGIDAAGISLPPPGSLGDGDARLLEGSGAAGGGLLPRLARPRASTLVVPLRVRAESVLGAMCLTLTERSGRRYSDADLRFARAFGEQMAQALEKAGLVSEIEQLQAQRTAALENLAEAVIIHDSTGRWVYVNPAAARLLGYESPAAVLADATPAILERFAAFHEDGRPLADEERPGRAVLAGRDAPPLLLRVIDRETGEERWRVTKATAVNDAAGRPQLAVNIIEDVTDVKRAELDQAFLARASELLAASLDVEYTLTQVAELAVPRLCDWCSVAVPDAGGLRYVALAHRDAERLPLARAYEERYPVELDADLGPAQVMRTGRPMLVNRITEELLDRTFGDVAQRLALREVGICAAMIVPMVAGGRIVGTMTFISDNPYRSFSPADLRLAEELARRSGTAIANARLYSENAEIAQTLQLSLLPRALPEIPGFALCSAYSPAGDVNIVGGDFYDVAGTSEGWMILIGDVTGRGARAASLTAEARHSLRVAATLLGDPLAAIAHLNRSLVEDPHQALCTVAAVHVVPEGERATATVVCAGHPQPVLVRGGEAREVGIPGPLIGAWDNSEWTPDPVTLEPGDVLVLYTDGVIDTRGAQDRFGEHRLLATLRDATDAQDAIARVMSALEQFRATDEDDDIALIAIGMTASEAANEPPAPVTRGGAVTG